MMRSNPYPMSASVRALYDARWVGEHVSATKLDIAACSREGWVKEVVSSFKLAKASVADMNAYDGSEWPNHPVYSFNTGYGMALAAVWQKHEAKIREFLGAKQPSFYTMFDKGHPLQSSDPAVRNNASKIVPQLEAFSGVIDYLEGIRMTDLPWGAHVVTVHAVRPHGENLSIVTTREGNEVIANKREDGSFRWVADEPCVYVPEGAIIPDDVLQERGYWDFDKGKGLLEGKKGNRVKMRRMAGFESRGLLFKIGDSGGNWTDEEGPENSVGWIDRGDQTRWVSLDDNVSDFFGITEHVAG